jgi:hypothetical protein
MTKIFECQRSAGAFSGFWRLDTGILLLDVEFQAAGPMLQPRSATHQETR